MLQGSYPGHYGCHGDVNFNAANFDVVSRFKYRIYFDFFFHKSENIGLWQSRMSPVAREINIYFQSELESLGNELIQLVTVGLRLKASCILPDLTHGGFETFGPI